MNYKIRSLTVKFSNLCITGNLKFCSQNNFDEGFQLVQKKKNNTQKSKDFHHCFKFFCTFCPGNCCRMLSIPHIPYRGKWPKRISKKRAGVLVLDTSRKFVLLVQSCGKLWGAAKGVIEEEETAEQAAIRELKEETGIIVEEKQLSNKIKIAENSYYILIHPKENLMIPITKEYNDVSGLGWVSLECLQKNFEYFKSILNFHALILIYKGLNICGFISIEMLPQNKIENFMLK
jgi:8-oxo-dGTP pyrophosphatase MutT (NUDIX family)